jgi:hypothetical protein
MRVFDTSFWIECLIASPIDEQVALKLPTAETWLVPTIV